MDDNEGEVAKAWDGEGLLCQMLRPELIEERRGFRSGGRLGGTCLEFESRCGIREAMTRPIDILLTQVR